jgi:hypothetical protein
MSVLHGDHDGDPITLFEITPRLAQLVLQIRLRDPPRELHLLGLLADPRPLFQRALHLPIPRLHLAPRRDAHDRFGRGRDELDDAPLSRREELLEAVCRVGELVRVGVDDVDVVERDLSVRRSTGDPPVITLKVGGWDVFKVASGGWGTG